jgi:hypothetical protein
MPANRSLLSETNITQAIGGGTMILRGSAKAGLLFLSRFSVAGRYFFLFFFFIVLRKTTILPAS